jgi:hypothetical protein
MEAIAGALGFGLGATLGVGAARAVGGSLRPVAREVIRAGLVVGDTVRAAGERARETAAGAAAGARGELEQGPTDQPDHAVPLPAPPTPPHGQT